MWSARRKFVVRRLASVKRIQPAKRLWLAAIAGLFLRSLLAQSGASYTTQRRIDTIVIDGKLNEASWANASSTLPFTLWDGRPAPASLQTTAKMLWDDQYLYLGFSVKDPDVYATYTGRDVPCWEQDNFEAFVTVPGTTGYIEVEGSPKGAIWDGSFTNVLQGPGGSYNFATLRVAAHVNGTLNNSSDQDAGFTGEIRLSFSDIYQGTPGGPPTNGTQLRMNLNRINWNTPAIQGGPGATGSDTYYAWSPVPGSSVSFHRPDDFGTVTLSTNLVVPPVWMFTAESLSGTNLVVSGLGHPGGTYWVLVSTNPALPLANWARIETNSFDPVTGSFSFTNSIAPQNSQLFYRLQSP
jgi:hypothetical protein